MTRTLPTGLSSVLSDDVVDVYYAVELLFDSSTIRLWTGYGDKTIGGETYTGTGNILSISGLEEVADLSAKSITLNLSAISSSIVSLALSEPYQNRECVVYLGVNNLDPLEVFSGYMNTMQITDEGETSSVQLTVDSKLVRLERASNWRYTNENHQSRYSGDTFFSYVTDLQDKQIVWGREKA
jgi:hypothetical protein